MSKADWQRTSIVLIGDFNPKIHHPAWFAAQKLISESEGEAATVEVINHDVCIVRTAWLRLEVFRERFQAAPLQDGRDEEVRDLVIGTFRVLGHTPVRMLGINTTARWHFPDEATWRRVGHLLVPKDPVWSSVLDSPGTAHVVVQGKRTDGNRGHIRVHLRPTLVAGAYGIEVQVNDQFELDQSSAGGGAEGVVSLLATAWDRSLEQAGRILNALMELPK